MMYFARSTLLDHPSCLNILVQAYPENTGTTMLSSTWRAGMGIPRIFFGIVNAGVGTQRSAKDPAIPNAIDANATLCRPPGIPFAPNLATERTL